MLHSWKSIKTIFFYLWKLRIYVCFVTTDHRCFPPSQDGCHSDFCDADWLIVEMTSCRTEELPNNIGIVVVSTLGNRCHIGKPWKFNPSRNFVKAKGVPQFKHNQTNTHMSIKNPEVPKFQPGGGGGGGGGVPFKLVKRIFGSCTKLVHHVPIYLVEFY